MLDIKSATLADVSAIARVEVETWRSTYAGILPDSYLIGMSERQRASSWLRFVTRRPGDLIVATDLGGEVIGFGSCGVQREPDLYFSGEIFTLYVLPDWQGHGVGRNLLLALFKRLVRCGLYSSLIWVLAENPARFFYERLGGEIVARHPINFARSSIDAIAYGWRDLAQAVVSPGRAQLSE